MASYAVLCGGRCGGRSLGCVAGWMAGSGRLRILGVVMLDSYLNLRTSIDVVRECGGMGGFLPGEGVRHGRSGRGTDLCLMCRR